MTSLPPLKTVVDELPEIYQPIYGHPEFLNAASRSDDSRLQQIMLVHNALARQLQRPVRVIDLGCAQGWFCFNLANAGAQVLGVDYSAANINVCNMLVLENRHLHARFNLLSIEQVPDLLSADQFDLVLGFSVFHHLCFHNGKEATRDLLGKIFEKIPVCLLELALASETGMEWVAALPDDPEYLIEQMPFFRLLSHHPTHLTSVHRPLYFGSSRFWYVNGELGEFSTWYDSGCGRRYFFNDQALAKLYRTTGQWGEINHYAIVRSAHFLKSPPADYVRTPKLLDAGEDNGTAWLVQEKIPGTMLSDMMQSGTPYDERAMLLGILKQLAALEKVGLFHTDIRVWNVLVGTDGFPLLIDYDAIADEKRDCAWPNSLFLAFFIFVNEVVSHRQLGTEMGRAPYISPFNLPEPYRSWGAQLWRDVPIRAWSFAHLLKTLEKLPMTKEDIAETDNPNELWMKHIEEMVKEINGTMQSMSELLHKLNAVVVADHKILAQHYQQPDADLDR